MVPDLSRFLFCLGGFPYQKKQTEQKNETNKRVPTYSNLSNLEDLGWAREFPFDPKTFRDSKLLGLSRPAEGWCFTELADARQGMRNGMTPCKPSPMVSVKGIPRFIPSFPAEHQQVHGCDVL